MVVAVAGGGLVAATPGGPVQNPGRFVWRGGEDGEEEAANFRNAQRDRAVALFCVAAAFSAAAASVRVAARKAIASIERVMWRCQPCQERTSYSSRPVSCLAVSKQHSTAHRRPVEAFAYPYGAYDGATLDILRRRGCRLAFTTHVGANCDPARPLEIDRMDTNDVPLSAASAPMAELRAGAG